MRRLETFVVKPPFPLAEIYPHQHDRQGCRQPFPLSRVVKAASFLPDAGLDLAPEVCSLDQQSRSIFV